MTEEQAHMARLLNVNIIDADPTALAFVDHMMAIRRDGGQAAFESALAGSPHNPIRYASYLQQENSVLHERVRKLEIALEAEREANAKLAEEYGVSRYHYEAEPGRVKQDAMTAAKAVATLIRGRGEK